MRMTIEEAETAIARMFPGCVALVADGYKKNEGGVVKDASGRTVASFRLRKRREPGAEAIPTVREIRVGQVGQFCGTIDEIRAFERSRAEE